jgi:transposase-like protein
MIIQMLHCPYCQGLDIVKPGMSSEGKQRYRCRACLEGRGRTFLLEYSYAQINCRRSSSRSSICP